MRLYFNMYTQDCGSFENINLEIWLLVRALHRSKCSFELGLQYSLWVHLKSLIFLWGITIMYCLFISSLTESGILPFEHVFICLTQFEIHIYIHKCYLLPQYQEQDAFRLTYIGILEPGIKELDQACWMDIAAWSAHGPILQYSQKSVWIVIVQKCCYDSWRYIKRCRGIFF